MSKANLYDDFISVHLDDTAYLEAVQEVSDYVQALNLPTDKNNELVALMLNCVDENTAAAFKRGFDLGLNCPERPKGGKGVKS